MQETINCCVGCNILFTYDSSKTILRREADDDFERCPSELLEIVGVAHQDARSMRYFDGAGNLMDAHIRSGLEEVVHVKLVAEEMNVLQIRNDL